MPVHPNTQRIVPKLIYEWEMFCWLEKRIRSHWKAANQPTKNLLMEGFLLHARVLRDFFGTPRRQDDVSACNFFEDDSGWQTRSKQLCPYLEKNRKRLNKKLAHLTHSRLTEDENWDFPAIRDEISEAWQAFLSALSESQRQWFNR